MRYIVGYGPQQRGVDAINLASTLARSSGASLDLVVVLPDDAPTFDMYSPDHAYNTELRKQGTEWLEDGLARVPADVRAEGHLVNAESVGEGLVEKAEGSGKGGETGMIVVGTSHHVRLGSIADALLHSASVPVALTPAEYEPQETITRITCATGVREGHEVLVKFAIQAACEWKVPLRLMSLVAVGESGSEERRQEWTELAELHIATIAQKAAEQMPAECPVTTVVGQGDTLVEAVNALEFSPSELVMVGSSRLAQPRRLFIGRTATKLMRLLPVPMIVVPRDYDPDES
ncbi:MAG: universal stress protein [Candidatus Nanopelagicales bacterium]|jgi:nucleotide-binding universal stress UspA family protein|nr:universal stress protein [Candidatus Nanopelagicales bacterium]